MLSTYLLENLCNTTNYDLSICREIIQLMQLLDNNVTSHINGPIFDNILRLLNTNELLTSAKIIKFKSMINNIFIEDFDKNGIMSVLTNITHSSIEYASLLTPTLHTSTKPECWKKIVEIISNRILGAIYLHWHTNFDDKMVSKQIVILKKNIGYFCDKYNISTSILPIKFTGFSMNVRDQFNTTNCHKFLIKTLTSYLHEDYLCGVECVNNLLVYHTLITNLNSTDLVKMSFYNETTSKEEITKTIPTPHRSPKTNFTIQSPLMRPNTKKAAIPLMLKRHVWNKYIGETVGTAQCYCCKLSVISQMSFHCGHVVAENKGGKLSVDNLRPICQSCNSSMGTTDMFEYMSTCGFGQKSEY